MDQTRVFSRIEPDICPCVSSVFAVNLEYASKKNFELVL